MAHRCGWPKVSRPYGPCSRRVADTKRLCWQHPCASRRRSGQGFHGAPDLRKLIQANIETGQPGTTSSFRHAERFSIRKAAELVHAACQKGWEKTISDQFTNALSESLWREVQHEWHAPNCELLAGMARSLLEFKRRLGRAVEELVDAACRRLKLSEPERFAVHVLIRSVEPTYERLVEIAHGLLIMGIYQCVLLGGDLEKCACLKDLAKELSPELFKKALWNVLPNDGGPQRAAS
jgi:hypothetical protein